MPRQLFDPVPIAEMQDDSWFDEQKNKEEAEREMRTEAAARAAHHAKTRTAVQEALDKLK